MTGKSGVKLAVKSLQGERAGNMHASLTSEPNEQPNHQIKTLGHTRIHLKEFTPGAKVWAGA
jgi:hypothetical protein